jgi:hypothetical protein
LRYSGITRPVIPASEAGLSHMLIYIAQFPLKVKAGIRKFMLLRNLPDSFFEVKEGFGACGEKTYPREENCPGVQFRR